MPLSTVLGAQSLIKPGVCTTATRPASPYTGQMIYDTTVSQALVWNGTAWANVGATAGGLVPITAETSFSATTGVTVSDVFTSTYSNYLLTVITTINGAGTVELQFSVGGTATATGYNYEQLAVTATTVVSNRQTSKTSGHILRTSNGTYTQVTKVDIYNPQVSDITMYQATALNQQSAATSYIQQIFGNQQATTQFDGFKLLSANNITGTYQLYGYNKTV